MPILIIKNQFPFNIVLGQTTSIDTACELAHAYNLKIANSPNDTYTVPIFKNYRTINGIECPQYTYKRYYRHWLLLDDNNNFVYTTPEERGETTTHTNWHTRFEFEMSYRKHNINKHRQGHKPKAIRTHSQPHIRRTIRLATDPELETIAPIRPKSRPKQDSFWDWHTKRISKSWKDQSKRRHQWR